MTRARKPGSAVAPAPQAMAPALPSELPALLSQVQSVLRQARQQAHRSVNRVMVEAYWRVGQLIVEHEQAGRARAAYGERVLDQLAQRLQDEFGAGFSVANLRNFRQFHLTFGWPEKMCIRDSCRHAQGRQLAPATSPPPRCGHAHVRRCTQVVGLCGRANGDLGEMSRRQATWLHRLQSSSRLRSTGMCTEAEAQRA